MLIESPQCVICGSTDYRVKAQRNGLDFGCCNDCGLAYVLPMSNDDQSFPSDVEATRTKAEYDRSMIENQSSRAKVAQQMVGKRVDMYTHLLGRRPEQVLEVGSGEGAWYEAYRSQGINWSGIDINKQLVEFAQQRSAPVQLQDFLSFKSEEPFDVIYASQVLEHCLDPNRFIRKARALLRRGAILHLDVPNHAGFQSLVSKCNPSDRNYGFLEPPHHQLAYTKNSLGHLLTKHEFTLDTLRVFSSDHSILGQLNHNSGLVGWCLYRCMDVVRQGSLLVAIAISPGRDD